MFKVIYEYTGMTSTGVVVTSLQLTLFTITTLTGAFMVNIEYVFSADLQVKTLALRI